MSDVRILATPNPGFTGTRGGIWFLNGRAEVLDPALAQHLCKRWGFKDITDDVRPKEKLLPEIGRAHV